MNGNQQVSLHIYVDGSCLDNQNVTPSTKAGWGYCVIEGDSGIGNGKGELVAESHGRVITDSDESGFIGAEVGSNNTAELSAIAKALRWVLTEGEEFRVEICTDSTYAGNIASGDWKVKANKELARFVQQLWIEVAGLMPLSWKHVRAHRGHRWNERADHLAFRAMQGESPLPLQFWKPGSR
ncbi:MAG TPA: RNase H family protein [Candidatus Thalassarchaeaceae archaeon]|jgi:ribonuclease HI|nr:RNase H family protein [Candidatus Thalassarchaeaceae archaeon]|tara:strand:- start:30433 stop:30978 length:546 start_codon:yes stop_codon:yes gene_type:complete